MATRRASGLAAIIATTAWLSSLTPDGLALRPAPAAAFPPCMTPQGYLIICCPKPCPVLDPQKLPTELTKLQNEISKLTSVAKQLQQWQSMLKAIGSNPMALLSMLRGSSDVSAFKGLTIPTAGAALAGADFSTIGGSKNAIANLFFNPSNTNSAARMSTVIDAKTNAVATGLHARSSMEGGMDEINKIAADAKKTQTARDELAIANRLRLAFLQILRNQNTMHGSMLELFGSSSALALGPESASPSAYSGGSTPYAPKMSPDTPTLSNKAATDLGAANAALTTAIDIHNGFAAVNEMARASIDASGIQNEQAAVDASTAAARQRVTDLLGAVYSNSPAATDALLMQAMRVITAEWPDSGARTAQESATALAAVQAISSNPDMYGAANCRGDGCLSQEQLSTLRDAIYAALDTAQQSNWYKTLTLNAADLKNTIAAEAETLTKTLGVDMTDKSQVEAAIAALVVNINAALAEFALDASTADQQAKAAEIKAALANLLQDPGFTRYLPYDPSVEPVGTGSAYLANSP
ncbi:MAG TPA: hypothetical protein P5256_00880 [Beijerinckiaceae bacterium]|nr:hypothetical protein [Rhodoblastus sp.]MCC2106103.1 hypothetical protein [Hyphomicrobiales bacterium]HRY01648.1 hypothetical protein [Beijerinckiaceae bacterium]